MAKRTYDDKMKLNMPFAEALERYVGTKPAEMHAILPRRRKRNRPRQETQTERRQFAAAEL
jgi:hypothetical protein